MCTQEICVLVSSCILIQGFTMLCICVSMFFLLSIFFLISKFFLNIYVFFKYLCCMHVHPFRFISVLCRRVSISMSGIQARFLSRENAFSLIYVVCMCIRFDFRVVDSVLCRVVSNMCTCEFV